MPRTWAFNPANEAISASYDGIWFVHIGVQARGKKASTTFFPRRSLKDTSAPSWPGRQNSGAFCPTSSFIRILPVKNKGLSHDAVTLYANKAVCDNHGGSKRARLPLFYMITTRLYHPVEPCFTIPPSMRISERKGAAK